MEMTMEEYYDATSKHEGFCTECKELTRDMCEPDAANYECPVCGGFTVFGIEEAMLIGYIEITD